MHQLLGADFRVLPRFTAPNAADLAASDAARLGDADDSARGRRDDRAGRARCSPASRRCAPAVNRLHRLRLVAELTTASCRLAAIQLPPRTDDVWLGAALPAGHEILDDTLSIIQVRPAGLRAGGQPRCGLLVDEWTESFPRKQRGHRPAFGFDQPNSAPLQSLLLAVAGEDERTWSGTGWSSIVRDTMLRAKLRAVEPDMLDTIPGVTTILPATMAEFSTSPGALSLDFGLSVPTSARELRTAPT